MTASIRPATASDLPQMVDLLIADAERRKSLNPALWSLAGDAREKVGGTVQAGLEGASSSNQDLWLLAEVSGRIVGIAHSMMLPIPPIYADIIAQPVSSLLMPATHDIKAVGAIDDFYHKDFANSSEPSNGASAAADFLSAAEAALARRNVNAALVACPAAWSFKLSFLERRGYCTVKLWMLKG